MLRGLVKDSVVYGVANGVQKLVPFVVIPLITAYLGQSALKVYDVAFAYAYLLSWLVIAGQDSAAAILFFDERKNNFTRQQVTRYAFYIQCCLLLVIALLLFFFHGLLGSGLFGADTSIITFWQKALLIIPGHMLLNYTMNLLLWQKRKAAYVLLCFCQAAISILGVYVLMVVWKGGLAHLFYALIASTTLCGAAGIFLVRSQVFVASSTFNKALLQKLLLLGLPFGITAFSQSLLPSVDRYFLLKYGYTDSMGVYALAVKLGAFAGLGINAFVLAFTPYSLAKLHSATAEKEISQLFKVVSISALLVVPFTLLFKDFLIGFFADASYQGAAGLLPFFFYGWVFDLFSYFSLLGVYKSQHTSLILILFIAATLLIAALNAALIPGFGLMGAAASFLATKAALFFASLIAFKRYFHLQLHLPSFCVVMAASAGCSYLVFVAETWISITVFSLVICTAFIYLVRQKAFARYLAV